MSLAEIEAELEKLSAEELRRLAMKSWTAFVAKESLTPAGNECEENDPELLAALDLAVAQAEAAPGQGSSANEVRDRLRRWITK